MFGVRKQLRAAGRRLMRRVWDRPAPTILMYHRIASPPYDPWGLAVAPSNFADQLRSLGRARHVVPMDTLLQRLESGEASGSEIALTFDDGYVDNLRVAKPILERAGTPATVFITTERLGAAEEFWWDELAHLFLGGTTAIDSEIALAGRTLRLMLPAAEPGVRSNWFWNTPPRSERERLYLEVWTLLQRLDEASRAAAMGTLRSQLGATPALPENLPMRREEVASLISGGLIRVGGHALTHAALTSLASDRKRSEIEQCKRELESIAGQSVSGFAYPFGDRDEQAMTFTRQAGYSWAVCTRSAAIDVKHFDRFDLPRMQVLDWAGDELVSQLSQLERAA